MKRVILLSAVLLFGLTQAGFAATPVVDTVALDQAFARLQTYDWMESRKPLDAIEQAVVATRGDSARRQELEQRLVAVLTTRAPRAAKDFVCRQLSVVGTAKSVPALAALLPDPDLSHMARFAFERIPDVKAAGALRQALPQTQGKNKIGIINSLGTLADPKAAGALTDLLREPDLSIAAPAAQALGKIGTSESARALAKFRPSAPTALRPLISEAYLLAGGRMLQKRQHAAAARIFRAVFEQEEGGLRMAAFRGLLAVEPKQAVKRLGKALAGDDEPLQNLAARIMAELPGDDALKPFLNLLPSLPASGQVALLDAIHSRCDASARSAVLAACGSGEPRVRLEALRALGVVGTAEDVPRLARLAASDGNPERDAARLALANLPGREPSGAILKELANAPPPIGVELIRAIAARGAIGATAALMELLKNSDESVRLAAVDALAVLGNEKQAPAIIAFLKAASDDDAFQRAAKTLEAIVTRVGPACCDALISGVQSTQAKPQAVLLGQLGRIGGEKALKVVRTAVDSQDAQVSNAAFQALSDWPGLEAAPALLELAREADTAARREPAFRGYVRLCRETQMPASERLNRLSQAAKLAANTGEKTLVASALADVPEPGSLKLLVVYLDDSAVVDAASVAAVKVASALDIKHKSDVAPVLERVVARCQNSEIQKQAMAVLKKFGASND
jgi:HEAT repeat protein